MVINKVLVVDDSATDRAHAVAILTQAGYQTLTAENGEEGIAAAKREQPDAILMDVVMPGVNGFQATRALTDADETKAIPIIICTTKSQESDRLWGLRQGARDYVVKPVDADELLRKLRAL